MGTTVGLRSEFVTMLDEVYSLSAKSSGLDAGRDIVLATEQANVVRIPKVALQGLGTYSKTAGFVEGDVTFSYETHTFTQDRGRTFSIDRMSNQETADTAFASVASQFIRTKVTPEIDAYRFATLATAATLGTSLTAGTTLSADSTLQAMDEGFRVLEDANVDPENCIVYVTPMIKKWLKESNLLTGRGTIDQPLTTLSGNMVVTVPQTRFYTAITLYDGTTGGQEAGSYINNGKSINFMIVDKSAVLGITKIATPRVFSPDVNQSRDAWKYDFRIYHDLFVPDNKVTGIYRHNMAS
jgi:hypothetical protein